MPRGGYIHQGCMLWVMHRLTIDYCRATGTGDAAAEVKPWQCPLCSIKHYVSEAGLATEGNWLGGLQGCSMGVLCSHPALPLPSDLPGLHTCLGTEAAGLGTTKYCMKEPALLSCGLAPAAGGCAVPSPSCSGSSSCSSSSAAVP